jgi:hypothetical protein
MFPAGARYSVTADRGAVKPMAAKALFRSIVGRDAISPLLPTHTFVVLRGLPGWRGLVREDEEKKG